MKIEYIDLNEIKPYHRNPRKNEETVSDVAKSIKKYGFKAPIVIREDGEIVIGHARYKAVNQLKGELEELIDEAEDEDRKEVLEKINEGRIPAIRAKDLSEKEAQELRIIDNKLTENSGWDFDDLKFEVREIDELIGFDEEELEEITQEEVEFDNYEDGEVEETQEELEEHHKELSQDRKERKIEVICPHCKEEFKLDKDELKRKFFDNSS